MARLRKQTSEPSGTKSSLPVSDVTLPETPTPMTQTAATEQVDLLKTYHEARATLEAQDPNRRVTLPLIFKHLTEQGIDLGCDQAKYQTKMNYLLNIKNKRKDETGERKPGRPRNTEKPAAQSSVPTESPPTSVVVAKTDLTSVKSGLGAPTVEELKRVRQIASEVGGLDRLKLAINTLEELRS